MTVPSIVILTGAGISAESGVSTFRDKGGIWAEVDYRAVATPEGFARDPQKVHAFYNQRRRDMEHVQPNAAHVALARLEREFAGEFLLVTQNIDDLHERAGSRKLIHMHGEIYRIFCEGCSARRYWREDLSTELICGQCGNKGGLRPDVVWFDERPYRLEKIYEALSKCDLFVAIGTSGTVHPAAGFVQEAKDAGAHTIHLNLEHGDAPSWFDEVRIGPATRLVPYFVEEMLRAGGKGVSTD
jgi:NAD-dependent deacetylase